MISLMLEIIEQDGSIKHKSNARSNAVNRLVIPFTSRTLQRRHAVLAVGGGIGLLGQHIESRG